MLKLGQVLQDSTSTASLGQAKVLGGEWVDLQQRQRSYQVQLHARHCRGEVSQHSRCHASSSCSQDRVCSGSTWRCCSGTPSDNQHMLHVRRLFHRLMKAWKAKPNNSPMQEDTNPSLLQEDRIAKLKLPQRTNQMVSSDQYLSQSPFEVDHKKLQCDGCVENRYQRQPGLHWLVSLLLHLQSFALKRAGLLRYIITCFLLTGQASL